MLFLNFNKRGLVFILSLCCTTFASAASVTLNFTGEVTDINDQTGGQASSFFSVGDVFTYSVTIDEAITTPSAGQSGGYYLDDISDFSFSFGNYSGSGTSGGILIRESDPDFGDMILITHNSLPVNQGGFATDRDDFTTTSGSIGGFDIFGVDLRLVSTTLDFISPNTSIFDTATAWAANSSVLDALNGNLSFTQGGDFGVVEVSVDSSISSLSVSAVPIPAAAWLFGSGILGLVSLKRRK